MLLASIECAADATEGWEAHTEHAEQALRDAGDDIALQARAHVLVACVGPAGRTVEFHARRALALLTEQGPDADPQIAAQAYLALQSAQLDLGVGLDEELFRRAAAAEARASRPPLIDRTKTTRACSLKYVDDLDGSRAALQEAIEAAGTEGIEAELPSLFFHVALTELWAGRYSAGINAAEKAIRLGTEIGMPTRPVYYVRGQLAAYTGDFEWVRQYLRSRLALDRDAGAGRGVGHCLAAIGAVELLSGDADAAAESLHEAYETLLGLGIREPSRRLRLESDYAQALIATGRFNEAAALAAELRAFGPRREAPTTRGIALRIEGMVEAGHGDLDRAVSVLEEAVAIHRDSPIPLERGRTLLALGQSLRRRRAKTRATSTLQEALGCFTQLGATPFIELARAELTTLGGAPKDATLTAAEQRAAVLAARGLSNREIATRLFVSGRTVESQLAAVYRKLGLRTRAELTRHLTQSKLHP
jgi:DNA-binding CsgD family transcriptional regulator